MKKTISIILGLTLFLFAVVAHSAMGITLLDEFLYGVSNAKFKEYENRKGVQIKDEKEFLLMQKHILNHYRGVLVSNSFFSALGRVVDCVLLETQPSLQTAEMSNHKIAKPPKPFRGRSQKRISDTPKESLLKPQLGENLLDKYKNPMYCKPDTVPLVRLNLETMTLFNNLADFFHKAPNDIQLKDVGDGKNDTGRRDPVPGDDDYTHYWAHGYQNVNNYGGDSRLNVWKPDAEPGWFSLAQHWYVGGNGASRQTVEGGWQVARRKYDNTSPNLFIYSTSANYSAGSGCYNLDCAAFVQINNSWVLGGSLSPVSTLNDTQYIFRMQWQYSEGNWWLFLKGQGAADPGIDNYFAIGYYPEEHFDGGQLTQHATKIDYGGEVSSLLGDDKTGEMGSGKFASEGWQRAAYQRTIYYIDTGHVSHWAQLSEVNNTPDCYTADVHNTTGSSWATYLYFGGKECPAP